MLICMHNTGVLLTLNSPRPRARTLTLTTSPLPKCSPPPCPAAALAAKFGMKLHKNPKEGGTTLDLADYGETESMRVSPRGGFRDTPPPHHHTRGWGRWSG